MSRPEGDSRPQPNSMSFAELIQKLRYGDPLEGQGDDPRIININSTPDIEARMFIDPDGNPVYNFGQKFAPEFKGWEIGQRVRSKFLARVVSSDDEERVELLVSGSVTGDVRHSDSFILEGLSQEEIQELRKLGLAELDATVKVVAPGVYKVSNMYDYPARLDRINAVQRNFNGDFSNLEKGTVLVEGQVVSYDREDADEKAGGLQVKLPTDQVIDIELREGYVAFDGGVLEILDPDYPLLGEKIQVSARYGNPNARYGVHEQDRLFAPWCRSVFLIEPTEERSRAYEEQRKLVAEQLNTIAQTVQPQDIRQRVSYILRTFRAGEGVYSRPTLTKAELRSLRGLVDLKIENEEERPLDLYSDLFAVEDIASTYGVDITSYSKKEFTEFCMQIASGKLIPMGIGASDYPWIFLDQLEPGVSEEILRTAVSSLAPKVIGKNLLHRERQGNQREAYKPEDLANPDIVIWEIKYLFDQSLKYLAERVSTASASVFLGLAQAMFEGGRFTKNAHDRRGYEEYYIFDAMDINLINNTDWNWQSKRVTTIKDEAVAKEYTSRLPMLRALSDKMKAEAWAKNRILDPSRYVDIVIDKLEQMDRYFKQQKAPLN